MWQLRKKFNPVNELVLPTPVGEVWGELTAAGHVHTVHWPCLVGGRECDSPPPGMTAANEVMTWAVAQLANHLRGTLEILDTLMATPADQPAAAPDPAPAEPGAAGTETADPGAAESGGGDTIDVEYGAKDDCISACAADDNVGIDIRNTNDTI